MRAGAPALAPHEVLVPTGDVSVMVPSQSQDACFVGLMSEYGRALQRIAAAHEWDRDEQEDLVQDMAFAVWKALPTFRGDCSERTFLYRIAHNRAMTHCARRRLRTVELQRHGELTDPSPGPAETVIQRDTASRVRWLVQRLPDTFRDVVVLRLEGLTNGEIGDVLGLTENNVAVRLNRARALLRAELQPTGEDE